MIVSDAVDIVNTLGPPTCIHDQIAYDCIADEREFSSAGRGRKRHRWTVEIRSGEAPALTLIAIVAGRAPVVRDGQVGHAIRYDTPAEFPLDHFLRLQPAAREIHRRQKLA